MPHESEKKLLKTNFNQIHYWNLRFRCYINTSSSQGCCFNLADWGCLKAVIFQQKYSGRTMSHRTFLWLECVWRDLFLPPCRSFPAWWKQMSGRGLENLEHEGVRFIRMGSCKLNFVAHVVDSAVCRNRGVYELGHEQDRRRRFENSDRWHRNFPASEFADFQERFLRLASATIFFQAVCWWRWKESLSAFTGESSWLPRISVALLRFAVDRIDRNVTKVT